MIHSISSRKNGYKHDHKNCKVYKVLFSICISMSFILSSCSSHSQSYPNVSILDQRDLNEIDSSQILTFSGDRNQGWDHDWKFIVCRPSGDVYDIHEESVNNTDKPGKTGEQGLLQWSYISAFMQKYGLKPIQGHMNDQFQSISSERKALIENHELVGADPYILYQQWGGSFDQNNRYSFLVDTGYDEEVPYLLFYAERNSEYAENDEWINITIKVQISNEQYYLLPLNEQDLQVRFSDVNLVNKRPSSALACEFDDGLQQLALSEYGVDGKQKYGIKGYSLYRDYTVPVGYQYEQGEVNRYYTLEYEVYTGNRDLWLSMVHDLGYSLPEF